MYSPPILRLSPSLPTSLKLRWSKEASVAKALRICPLSAEAKRGLNVFIINTFPLFILIERGKKKGGESLFEISSHSFKESFVVFIRFWGKCI